MTVSDWTKVFSFPLFLCIVFLFPQVILYWEWIAVSIVVLGSVALYFLE
jgi:hypothetical protein